MVNMVTCMTTTVPTADPFLLFEDVTFYTILLVPMVINDLFMVQGWSSNVNAIGQWVQIDLGRTDAVLQVITQGRVGTGQWVRSYKLQYASDKGAAFVSIASWNSYSFEGNFDDAGTKVYATLPVPVFARYSLHLSDYVWVLQLYYYIYDSFITRTELYHDCLCCLIRSSHSFYHGPCYVVQVYTNLAAGLDRSYEYAGCIGDSSVRWR